MKITRLILPFCLSLFALSENAKAMLSDSQILDSQDVNDCRVRVTYKPYAGTSYGSSVWEVHDPIFNKRGNFYALIAYSCHVINENGLLITKLELLDTNTAPTRAINAFLGHALDFQRRNETIFVWVNKKDDTYRLLTQRFAFREDSRPLHAINSAESLPVPSEMTQLMGINTEIHGKLILCHPRL